MSTSKQLLSFTEDLALLLNSGARLADALTAIGSQFPDMQFKEVIQNIEESVREGSTLSKSMTQYPRIFDPYYVSMIENGETQGNLGKNLATISQQLEHSIELKNKLSNALTYPLFLVAATVISVALILVLIVPQFAELIQSYDLKSNFSTQLLVGLSRFLQDWGLVLLAAIGLVIAFIIHRSREQNQTAEVTNLIKRLPFARKLANTIELARFSNSVGSLLNAGIPQNQALKVAAHALSQEKFDATKKIINDIESGHSLSTSLSNTDEFSQIPHHSLQHAEESGKLSEALLQISKRLERDFGQQSQQAISLIEPVLILLVGLMVGGIVYILFSSLQNISSVVI